MLKSPTSTLITDVIKHLEDSTTLSARNKFNSNNFWWVNHKQTFRKEFEGGYIWSPKTNKDGSSNEFYKNLTKIRVGDIVFSFADAKIKCIGVASSACREAHVPEEFGDTGKQWDKNGYLVEVVWHKLDQFIRPKEHIFDIKHLLPSKYSPIQENGNGNQSCYLASISQELANKVLDLIEQNNSLTISSLQDICSQLEEDQVMKEILSEKIPATEKEQLIKARVGQGIFKNRVLNLEKCCRMTGITNANFLIASHIKPWRSSNNFERLDGNNGLLLSPHVDKLFDKGYITFKDNGDVLVAKDALSIIKEWNIPLSSVGPFNVKQKEYLLYHRNVVFKDK